MPTILYLTALKLAKRVIVTRSNFIAYQNGSGLPGGCEHFDHFFGSPVFYLFGPLDAIYGPSSKHFIFKKFTLGLGKIISARSNYAQSGVFSVTRSTLY